MNILEALFGFTDIYQKAQKKRKTRIERKQILENPGYGRMLKEMEQDEQPVNEASCETENDFREEEAFYEAERGDAMQKDTAEILSDVKELLNKTDEILQIYQGLCNVTEEQKEALKDVQKSIEEHSSAIEEKIHSENVKSYRNVQAALDEMEKKTAKEESLVLLVSSLRTQLKCTTWFSVITLLVMIAYILFSLGVF